LNYAQDANDRRGINRLAQGLIVEANVAAGDGRAQLPAGGGETLNDFAKLPHYLGFFRAAEIEAVSGRNGPRAAASYIASCFSDGMHRSGARIQLAPPA